MTVGDDSRPIRGPAPAPAPSAPDRGRPRGAADRVRLAQRQARWTMPVVGLFVVGALSAGALDSRWAMIHLVLAGATVLVISAASLMLAVTWSAAPAPPDSLVVLQRTCVTVGVAVLVSGRQADAPTWVPVLGAAGYAAGLLLLAGLLVLTVRRGVERRYDPPVAGYAVALLAGVVGAALGADMVVGSPTVDVRDAHRVVNLLGLVGIVVVSTLPFFAATVVRSKMNKAATPPRLLAILATQAVAVAVAVVGLLASASAVGAVGLAVYAGSVAAVAALLPRPTKRQLDWAGPRMLAIWLGTAWWVVAAAASAVAVARGRSPFDDPWLGVLVISAYGQIVWGSLAYLLPVLRGGGHRLLSAGFALTRSWEGLIAVNVVAIAMIAGITPVAVAAVGVWVASTAVRFTLLATGPTRRPPSPPTPVL